MALFSLSLTLLLSSALASPVSSTAGGCTNITAYRSASVVASFDASKLQGFFYEQAFSDIAQLGASCQTMNNTLRPDGTLSSAFSVKYGPAPFTIVENYSPHVDGARGHFSKTVEEPGASFVVLDSVVVDAVASAEGGDYNAFTMYSCIVKLGVVVDEISIATRAKVANAADIEELQKSAATAGVPNANSVKRVDQSKCSNGAIYL